MKKKDKPPTSPLRYPGGKSRAVKTILKLFPPNTTHLCSPFLGGGSIELAAAHQGIIVHAYDIFTPLIEFWQCLLSNPKKLAKIISSQFFPLPKEKFYYLQKNLHKIKSKYKRAAAFFALNRASFSGATLSGGMSPNHPRFTKASIQKIAQFKIHNLHIQKKDFKESIPLHPNSLLYLDPPYLIKNHLYGKNGNTHKNFDHLALFNLLSSRNSWILSYNNSPEITSLYKNFKIIHPKWKYGMPKNKNSKEIIILSHDIAQSTPPHIIKEIENA